MSTSTLPRPDLREACVAEAQAIIGQGGIESLSLREVARRLGVSHQAPYKHFPSRDHILAEIVRRAFADFTAALSGDGETADPAADSLAMGQAYVAFALDRPLHYRLMFGCALPDPAAHPAMMAGAQAAFDVLRRVIVRLMLSQGRDPDPAHVDLEALFAWSSLHGVVSLMHTDSLAAIDLSRAAREGFAGHALARIGAAFGIVPASPSPPGDLP